MTNYIEDTEEYQEIKKTISHINLNNHQRHILVMYSLRGGSFEIDEKNYTISVDGDNPVEISRAVNEMAKVV